MNFRAFALLGECPEIAAALLQSRKINFYDDQVFVKQPKTSERTAYHQDSSYFHFEGDQACTMWIPVDPVSFNSGTIRYVRGSHRWGFFKPNVFVSQMAFPGADGEVLPDIDGHEEQYDIVSYELEPGDMLVHHHLTVHGSAGNATLAADAPRCLLALLRGRHPLQVKALRAGASSFPPPAQGRRSTRLRAVPGGVAAAGTDACRRLDRGTSKGTPGCYRRSRRTAER